MKRIVIAGLGNELRGDDGFGVAVARRLRGVALPEGVTVHEVGLRSFDLALLLLEASQAVLVDALPRGGEPGRLHLLEVVPDAGGPARVDPHALHPAAALDLVRALGGTPPPITVVGCEPLHLASEEEPSLELSAPVQAAVPAAVELVRALVRGEAVLADA